MARNIEIKARVKDVKVVRKLIEQIAGKVVATLKQVDTYFAVQHGRLKLRTLNDHTSELIYYVRSDDSSDPRRSDYKRVKVSDKDGFKNALATAIGLRGVVKKKRKLYKIGTTRVHLDEVDDLGTFLELEIPITARTDEDKARERAKKLMDDLGVRKEDLLSLSYIDILLAMSHTSFRGDGARMIPYYDELMTLRLPTDKYALFGSALLALYRIRPASDLDVIVKKDLWNQLERKYSNCIKQSPLCIQIGNIEIYKDWMTLTDDVDEMIDTADMIENVPFVKFEYVVKWKRLMGRPKDLSDIRLIEAFMKRY